MGITIYLIDFFPDGNPLNSPHEAIKLDRHRVFEADLASSAERILDELERNN